MSGDYDILRETFCIYCQRYYKTAKALQRHVRTKHPRSYADASIKEAKAKQS